MKENNVAIVGSGSREQAIAWKIRHDSPQISHIYMFPGNAGTESINGASNVGGIDLTNNRQIVEALRDLKVRLAVIGQEKYLFQGLPSQIKRKGIDVFGPTKSGAMLEESKRFSAEFNREFNILQPEFAWFDSYNNAASMLNNPPEWAKNGVAVKADGPSLGTGVYICQTMDVTKSALDQLMVKKVVGDSGSSVVIQQLLTGGYEISAIALTDGNHFKLLPLVKDFKRLKNGDLGPNTGSMGAVYPHPFANGEIVGKINTILTKVMGGLKKRKIPYHGALYLGLYVIDGIPYVLEYNTRLGGGETEVQMPIVDSNMYDEISAAAKGTMTSEKIKVKCGASVGVKLASERYPSYDVILGREIFGLDSVKGRENVIFFHSGTKKTEEGKIVTSSGGVAYIVGLGKTRKEASENALSVIGGNGVRFEGMQYRTDIH